MEPEDTELLDSLMETNLYALGAAFQDDHPELVDEVIAQATAIEATGIERWSHQEDVPVASAFQTLVTGLACRYARALSG